MQLTTPVEFKKGCIRIDHKNRIMLLGSCFAQNIGQRLAERKFDICSNPFGIIYNPLSIATVLRRVISGEEFNENSPEIFESEGRWHSILHHSDFSRKTREEFLHHINSSLQQAHEFIKEVDTIVITLGTAYVYERRSDGLIVSNCHKLPAATFNRRLVDIEEIAENLGNIVKSIASIRPEAKILFTVSPIRHLRDGAHDNQLSKATLLLATEKVRKAYPDKCDYFPAYEIMMDELRDYRFYAEDMTHPSPLAVEYIWEKFSAQHITEESIVLSNAIEEISRGLAHRPFDAESDGYRKFIANLLRKITQIKELHTHLDFEKDIERCNTLLNK